MQSSRSRSRSCSKAPSPSRMGLLFIPFPVVDLVAQQGDPADDGAAVEVDARVGEDRRRTPPPVAVDGQVGAVRRAPGRRSQRSCASRRICGSSGLSLNLHRMLMNGCEPVIGLPPAVARCRRPMRCCSRLAGRQQQEQDAGPRGASARWPPKDERVHGGSRLVFRARDVRRGVDAHLRRRAGAGGGPWCRIAPGVSAAPRTPG